MKVCKKVLLSFAVFVLAFVASISFNQTQASAIERGACGTTVRWELEGDTLTIIGKGDFYHYERTDYSYEKYKDRIKKVIVKKGVTNIGRGAFSGFTNLENVKLPKGVKTLEKYCFSECRNLKSVKLPKGVKSLKGYCFNGCTNLESVKLPKGVKELCDHSFFQCINLKYIKIPKSVNYIGTSCFWNSGLIEIKIPNKTAYIAAQALACPNLQRVYVPRDGYTNFNKDAFVRYCGGDKEEFHPLVIYY